MPQRTCTCRVQILAGAADGWLHRLESATLMPGYGTAFGRGLILGAGVALLYAAARETMAPARRPSDDDRSLAPDDRSATADDRNRMIDWECATRVAIRAAGRTPTLHPGARAQLQTQYENLLREIEQPIAGYV